MGVHVDDDTVLFEDNAGLVHVDIAGCVGVAAKVIAAVRAGKELLLQRAFKRSGRDP